MIMPRTKSLKLRLERTIRAPRERVFEAWTKPEHLRRWSAPEGLSIGDGDLDLRLGGRWRVVMLEENGTRHEAFGTYREITPPARLVYTHAWVREGGAPGESTPETLVTVEFHEEDGATRVVLIQEGFETVGARDDHQGGWSSTLDRLEAMFAPSR
jgi:uncharacterized protein YndB with AHSA1/START domain